MEGDESFPELDGLEVGQAYLDRVFPEALMIVPAVIDDRVALRLRIAGLGLGEVLFADGSSHRAAYVTRKTPHTVALERILKAEQSSQIPAGSHDRAIDSIIGGEFIHEWAGYLP